MGESQRLRILITGAVQGVGFRPFIYRLAKKYHLAGFINNSSQGVLIEAEGNEDDLKEFLQSIENEKPPHAFIQDLECAYLEPAGYSGFEIQVSSVSGEKSAIILPDIATCPDCLEEIFSPNDRRYLYPFTNCTNCGPRFTIIEDLPYDRPNTSMKVFPMCGVCLKEYSDPENRRFHAQPNACPVCGPHLEFWDGSGTRLSAYHDALEQAASEIRSGKIVAVKGIGGFLLMADAGNDDTLRELRSRKRREEKPFALMAPDISWVESYCEAGESEHKLLHSPQSPIVLVRKSKQVTGVSDDVAPGNPHLGVMLPYSPLHHILMRLLKRPVIATSGNLSDEPICTDEHEALTRLKGIADYFLVHNRPIVRHADDSIARIVNGREMILRRARGYAPLPVLLGQSESRYETALAVGAHLKNTVALNRDHGCFVSQHIGDLDTLQSRDAFGKAISDLRSIYQLRPSKIISDLHPDYASTGYAVALGIPHFTVQHHVAHIAACMAENHLDPPVLGVAWDGTGYGDDGTVWGGEFIVIEEDSYRRAAHLRTFLLPGGDQAVKEPRRSALGLLHEISRGKPEKFGLPTIRSFSDTELSAVSRMLSQRINCVYTSSAGRLFDAVASIAGLRQICRYEGQAAMELEFEAVESDGVYPFRFKEEKDALVIDWEPMILSMIEEYEHHSLQRVASRFHVTLSEMILETAKKIGLKTIVLGGGCFQNKRLLELVLQKLSQEGFKVFWPRSFPVNDGGISLGQITAALKWKHLLKKT